MRTLLVLCLALVLSGCMQNGSEPSLVAYSAAPRDFTNINFVPTASRTHTEIVGSAMSCVDNMCYIFGTFQTFKRLNTDTQEIEALPNMPFSHNFGLMKSVVVGTDIYIPRYMQEMGGTNDMWRYDTVNGTWTKLASSIYNHQHATSAVYYNNKIYVASDNNSTQSEYYDIDADQWHSISAAAHARVYPNSVVYNDKLYLFGGEFSPIKEFDIDTGTWSASDYTGANTITNQSPLVGVVEHTAFILADNGSLLSWRMDTKQWSTTAATFNESSYTMVKGWSMVDDSIYVFRGESIYKISIEEVR